MLTTGQCIEELAFLLQQHTPTINVDTYRAALKGLVDLAKKEVTAATEVDMAHAMAAMRPDED